MRPIILVGVHIVVLYLCRHSVVAAMVSGEENEDIPSKLWIESERVFVRGEPANVRVTCASDAPVRRCQFSWFSGDAAPHSGPLASLSEHDTNATYWRRDEPAATTVNSTLRFVQEGCELVLEYESFRETVVGCRVADGRGGWKYAIGHIDANERGLLPVDVNPRDLSVVPGLEVTLSCNASEPLHSCRFSTPDGRELDLDRGVESQDATAPGGGRYRYRGTGLHRGECGLSVTDVTAGDQGLYGCLVTTAEARAQRRIKVAVASYPANPVIRLEYIPTAAVQPTVKATCVHERGSSGPITWLVDNKAVEPAETLRRDDDDVTVGGRWSWPWNEAVAADHSEEASSMTVSPAVTGRRLKCAASYPALEEFLVSDPVLISRDYPPFEMDLMINYEKGITLKATCKTGESRPVAKIAWYLNDRIVRQDGVNDADDDDDDAVKVSGSVSQTLYVKLKPQDDAKMLRCVIWHPKLAEPIERFERVWYKPVDTSAIGAPDEVVALPGREARLACVSLATEPKYLPKIETCSYKLAGRQQTAVYHPPEMPAGENGTAGDGYRFRGGPVELGGCGLTLERVTEADNGQVLCRIESDYAILYQRYITVVVAHPPDAPVLHVQYDGPVLKASCTVGPSRPVANIAWMLGEDVIRQQAGDDSPLHVDRDNATSDIEDGGHAHIHDGSSAHNGRDCRSALVEAPIMQTVMWRLEPEDNGKLLRCVVSHPSLDGPVEDTHEILF